MRRTIKLWILCSIITLLIMPMGCKKEIEGTKINRAEMSEYAYVASMQREPFHKPTCRWAGKIAEYNLVGFKTRQEALDSGRRPCKICRP